ncbi:hypothetical protein [Nocardia sp. NBC_00403]|uniref:hypothetical protein n=1 Tax=Nocardia sp. NBC_00403 TaxID=2975990 RepID=UPI002E1BDAED
MTIVNRKDMLAALLHWNLVWRSAAENERIRALADVIRELGPMTVSAGSRKARSARTRPICW